jgi:diguanylate cyclase (GGDEF)-like protein
MSQPSQQSAPVQGRFSLEQIRQMMLVEFQRAQRQRYPLVCLVIGVDDFADLIEVYGEDRKAEIMQQGFGLLKRVTREHGVHGIGCWTRDRLLAIFPHLDKQTASAIGAKIVEGAHELKFEREDHAHSITLSVGVSRNMHEDTDTLENLIRAAERGLAMATEAGGDRFVHWKEVESELEKIRAELEAQTKVLHAKARDMSAEADAEQTEDEKALILRVREVFATHGGVAPAVQDEVLDLVSEGMKMTRQKLIAAKMAEHNLQMELLERRINKMNKTLGLTTERLKQMASMKSIDLGIASIYRDVQGIGTEDSNAEMKKEMMAEIFKANLALKQQLTSKATAA